MWHYAKIVVVSYLMVLLVACFDRKFDVGFWKELLRSSILSLLQLVTVGFVILFLLKLKLNWVNFAIVLLFFVNASVISTRRFEFKGYPRKWGIFITFLSISIMSVVSLGLLYVSGILHFKANSLIPLAGIVTAAGMRSLSLSYKYLKTKLRDLEEVILGMAALGASDAQVFHFIFRELINDITVPIRDMLRSAGIVHIPGVMVGLLLAGTIPIKAALVQFAVLSTMVFQFTFVPTITLFTLVKKFGVKVESGGVN